MRLLVRSHAYAKSNPWKRQDQDRQLSCSYSIFKAVVTIVQVGYGSFGLWQISGQLVDKYGYPAYPLTTIPYILLSFVNLLANLCQPQYPAMFLVFDLQARGNQPPAGEMAGLSPETGCAVWEELREKRKSPRPFQDAIDRVIGFYLMLPNVIVN